MKLFDLDWTHVLCDLPRWSALPLPARRLFLDELKTHGYVPGQRFGPHLNAIVASGIPQFERERNRLWVGDEHRAVVKVLRAMDRHPVFDEPTPPSLVKYMEEHFTQDDIVRLGSDARTRGHVHVTRQSLALRVACAGWPGDLLDAGADKKLIAWATACGLRVEDFTIFRLRDLRRLAQELLAFPNGVPLAVLVAQRQDDDMESLAEALHTGLGTLVIFAAMRVGDLEPMVGLWPGAVHELMRPPAQQPAVVVPTEHFAFAARMEDMTALLATVVAAPVRVRADDLAVFARAQVAIEARLVAIPMWAAHLFVNPRLTRVDEAARALQVQGFVQIRPYHGNPHLEATAAGARWLALSGHDRLASLIDPMRTSNEVNPPGAYDSGRSARFFPFSLPYYQAPKSLKSREALTRAFLGAANGFIPLEPFLDHAALTGNPFFALPPSSAPDSLGMMYYDGDPRESHRNLWRSALSQFFVTRLVGLGGASIGRLANGTLSFTLTDVGRYLLGAREHFEYGSGAAADVVIQPNFDVVFLGAAPSTEATIARFAQRVGVAPGLVFKITRASVLSAAEAGAAIADVIGALTQASSRPLPKNVEREIAGWMATVRRARLRAVEVIECADEEAGDRVAVLLGVRARRFTPTMFELPAATPSARAAVLKRLRAGGVFLDDVTGRSESRAKPKRQRYEDEWEDEGL